MTIHAVLFDVDGTLIDTSEYIYQAFEHSLRHHDHPLLTREEMSHMIGTSLEDCYRAFTELETVEHLMEAHHDYQIANPDLAVAFPHSISTLEALREKGISIAAITSRRRDTAQETLETTELYPLIDYFIGFEDVSVPKPDPEGIRKALNYLSVKPGHAYMVGDSPVDVEAGRNAGVHTMGVTYGFHGERIIESEPDYVIDDIAEVLEIIQED